MIGLGIIGTENSHAMAFAKYFNLPDPQTGKMHYEDIRVVAVMGDAASTSAIVQEASVAYVAQHVQDFFGRVDAIMITSRKGSVHCQYAMPFALKGMPLFIDKPFTSDPEQAKRLYSQILANKCQVMGGSGCKYTEAISQIQALVCDLRSNDEFMGAAMNFRVMLDSEYDGIYFYASHLIEMCFAAFGYDAKAVQAMRVGDQLTATVQYQKDAVSLHFTSDNGSPSCTVYGKSKTYYFDIDISQIYPLEAGYFADMLHGTHRSLNRAELIAPVYMIDAIQKSLASGSVVYLNTCQSNG